MLLGLTGPSGSGKGVVADVLRQMGVGVIDCDRVARSVTEKGSACLAELADAFGDDILLEDGSLLRQKLAEKAFACPEKTALLNAITHPYIRQKIEEACQNAPEEILCLDAPTLFQSGLDKKCDFVIGVLAEKEIRKVRIMQRDNLSEESAQKRMSAQLDDAFFEENCHKILYNNGSKEEVCNAAKEMLDAFKDCWQK